MTCPLLLLAGCGVLADADSSGTIRNIDTTKGPRESASSTRSDVPRGENNGVAIISKVFFLRRLIRISQCRTPEDHPTRLI